MTRMSTGSTTSPTSPRTNRGASAADAISEWDGYKAVAAARIRTPPQRSCLSCRERRDQRSLTRLVRGADGSVGVDERGRAPGRGGYLCESPACWQQAIEEGRLDRALRTTVSAADRATLRVYAQQREASRSASTAAAGTAWNGEHER